MLYVPKLLEFDDLIDQLEASFLEQGLDYFRSHKVSEITHDDEDQTLTAQVKGKKKVPYKISISVDDELLIDGDCSCKVNYNCKHVAAVLMADMFTELSVNSSEKVTVSKTANQWQKEIDKAQQAFNSPVESVAEKNPQKLIYVLTLHKTSNIPKFQLHIQTARQQKDGFYSDEKRYNPSNFFLHGPKDYMVDVDIQVIHQLRTSNMLSKLPDIELVGKGSGELLNTIISTGRCLWKNLESTSLELGKNRNGKLSWQVGENGCQSLVLKTNPAASIVLPTTPPLYLDLDKNHCGNTQVTVPSSVLDVLLKTPPIAPEEIESVIKKLEALKIKLPPPDKLTVKNQKIIPPTALLTLTCHNESMSSYLSDVAVKKRSDIEPIIKLKLDYQGNIIHPSDEATKFIERKGNTLTQQSRDIKTEKKMVALLRSFGAVLFTEEYGKVDIEADTYVLPCSADKEAERWVDFILEELPILEKNGWLITKDPIFPFKLALSEDWVMTFNDSKDQQSFELEIGITVDDEYLNLLPVLIKMISHYPELAQSGDLTSHTTAHHLLINLKDGRILPLAYKRLQALLDIIVDMFEEGNIKKNRVHLPNWRAAELLELDSEYGQFPIMRWAGSERLREYALRVKNFSNIKPIPAPENFNAELRPYQEHGLAWLQFLREFEFNGILADDMGLGKTVQTLAHILIEKQQGRLLDPVLVVAPTTLMINWRKEAQRFTPELTVLTLHGSDRKKHYTTIQNYDIVLTTYPLLTRDEEIIMPIPYHMVILDEAQYIKNSKSKATQAVAKLNTKHRLCLTGTPLENHLGELWSIYNYLMPGLLGHEAQFKRLFRTTIEKFGNNRRAEQLAKRVSPFLLRRTKEVVASDLPPKTEIIRTVPLEGEQFELYEKIRVLMNAKVSKAITEQGANKSHIIVLDALLKLRQVCCDPRLVKLDEAQGVNTSAKLDLLMGLIPELLEEGRKILLFSQFTSMLSIIEDEIKLRQINYVKLTGRTKDRETPINKFQEGDTPLFLISLKAGGTGLNLTAADTVIHYDPWWNPAVEQQATDRAHRIGQDKPVFVYKLYTAGTVEDRIQEMQHRKKALADNLFEGAGKGNLPNSDEMQALFQAIDTVD
ncbi:COG0553: Superfamily II DNA/RNA helicases, SNF2 family [hydrothermal vent metagenome]|uniref:COG0553: Superfamily II DNA/RNA helicases, SNF2 family n=1 Tax=hydrothermal vent metagenome TaxID=652676 RepID=A0A3B1AGY8_9ZZZZ